MSLSQRRAEAVKHYLMAHHRISAARMHTTGKGPTELFDKSHPDSAANRRVVFATQVADKGAAAQN
jgi:outer membrane protein OmpA-like peptidoglycan-associated protein